MTSPENLFAMRKILKPLRAEVLTAQSGNDALALTLHNDFAVALLDVQMPEMDGFELASLMRDHDLTQHIPIIFLTAISKEEKHIFEGYEKGAVDYLFKPIDPSDSAQQGQDVYIASTTTYRSEEKRRPIQMLG